MIALRCLLLSLAFIQLASAASFLIEAQGASPVAWDPQSSHYFSARICSYYINNTSGYFKDRESFAQLTVKFNYYDANGDIVPASYTKDFSQYLREGHKYSEAENIELFPRTPYESEKLSLKTQIGWVKKDTELAATLTNRSHIGRNV